MIKRFRLGILIRVLLLTVTLFLLLYLLMETQYYISIGFLVILTILQIIFLIQFVEKTNLLLTRFLESIRYSDFTGTFQNHGLGSNFKELNEAFARVIDKFKEERGKKEDTLRYLETVVQHIGIGLICVNADGEIVLINRAAKRLFGSSNLRTINSFKNISGKLAETITKLEGGGRSLLRISVADEILELAIDATEFRMRGEAFKLVSFQNIQTELEQKEMESWQNITQVLAHEIMNSITPIASLSGTIHMLVQQRSKQENNQVLLDPETAGDVNEALNTINKRSHGLMRFVNSYRDFTQIPTPNYEHFSVKELLHRIEHLMKAEFEKQGITVKTELQTETLELHADPQLIEQILINLTKNALRALRRVDDPELTYKAGINIDGRVFIDIIDNGPGIKKEDLEKIFIPFYSTAGNDPDKGTGIGLSLSRQIMRLHGGALQVHSEPEKETAFTLKF
ncbi:sensor histidine kinase [Rhodohalobacter sp. 614A]|uniref:sensor histidine kinase n=1 Tax=Rhodohalobacter sp. 614A TaxID=2908649 RepID=UPI001F27BFEC|nr:ATP-binding protein [Rhodohalobacter sp. 614A]